MGEENHRVHVVEEDGFWKKGGLSRLQVRNMAAQEVKTHDHCPECDKVFSSGKALGGHISTVHSRAKKDLSSKKLKKKQIKNEQRAEFICLLCEKDFRSRKAVYGHMRMHSDRDLRGMTRPTKSEIPVDLTKDDGRGSPGTKSSVVDEFPDLWNLANLAVFMEDNVGKVLNFPEQRFSPGDYETAMTTTSAYYCPDCSLAANRLESSLKDDASSEEPESAKFKEESGLGEKLPVDGLEGTSCVEVKKLTGKRLKKLDSNLLEITKPKKKKTGF